MPFPPTGPSGWRQLGLIVLLALFAGLLFLRGCGPGETWAHSAERASIAPLR